MTGVEARDRPDLKRMYFRVRPSVQKGLRIASAKQGVPMEILLDRLICENLPSLGGPRIAPRVYAKQPA